MGMVCKELRVQTYSFILSMRQARQTNNLEIFFFHSALIFTVRKPHVARNFKEVSQEKRILRFKKKTLNHQFIYIDKKREI